MTHQHLEFHMALRSEVAIGAAPGVVWDYLDRQPEWKPSIVSFERCAGKAGEEGEVLRIGQRPTAETVHVIMRTLRVVPMSWRVQTLATEFTDAVDGYVLYSLADLGGATQLCCDFVARCRVPIAAAGSASLDEFATRATSATAQKLDADHQLLKALAERTAAA